MKTTVLLLISFASIVLVPSSFAETGKSKLFKAKALYLPDSTLKSPEAVQHYINLAKHSEINAYVIDVKGIDGMVKYKSKIAIVLSNNAWIAEYDVPKLVRSFHANHIHAIARIACFNDPYMPVHKPEWAIKDKQGNIYNLAKEETWLNPVNQEVWKYLVDVAKESMEMGFDEIQFDYVRFPFDRDSTAMVFGEKITGRHKVIDSFLAYARKEMPNTVLSADVFGIICQSVNDPENIGQNLEYVGKNLDYISPMIYPCLYAKGQIVNGKVFEKPDLDPYGVVNNALLEAKSRIAKVQPYRANIRPYLQAFTASWLNKEDYQPYGAEQIKQQIKAAKDAGAEGWILWNQEGRYPEDAFLSKH